MLKVPVSNISDNGFICFGDKIGGRSRSLIAAVQNAIMVFWGASFNTDYIYNYHDYQKMKIPVLNSYFEWQYMSRINPLFIYNADWIKMDYNIGQRIKETKEYRQIPSKRAMDFNELSQIFYNTVESDIEVKSFKKAKKSTPLYFDIAQGAYLSKYTTPVNVGDSFITKNGKTAFIDSFAGFSDGSKVQYVQLDIEGKIYLLKLHEKACHYISTKILEQKRVSTITLPNGTVVKPEDILIVKQNSTNSYFRVEYIRKSRGSDDNEVYELKMGNSYFLSSSLDGTIFNVDSPVIDGIEMKKDKQYIIVYDQSYNGCKTVGGRVTYNGLDVSSSGNIHVNFKNANPRFRKASKTIELSKTPAGKVVYEIDSVKRFNSIFRVGRQIMYVSTSKDQCMEEVAWATPDGILITEGFATCTTINGKAFLKMLINDDTFFVEGVDFDIDFKIGEKVVCANWQNPLDVLTVKTIQGFKVCEKNYGSLYFILADKQGNITEQEYVDGRSGVIHTGKIRKVTNKIGKLKTGTKITAKTAGIQNFPKKDVNIIVAFIIDTEGEPLVLCSNGCTLWLTDVINYFDKTTMKSKKWDTMPHVPLDLSKIKYQAGDIINGTKEYKTTYGYVLIDPSPTRALRAMPLEFLVKSPEAYCLDKYMARECRLDCIPAPRVPTSKIEEVGVLKGTLNFHSYDVIENHLQTKYLNQRRS